MNYIKEFQDNFPEKVNYEFVPKALEMSYGTRIYLVENPDIFVEKFGNKYRLYDGEKRIKLTRDEKSIIEGIFDIFEASRDQACELFLTNFHQMVEEIQIREEKNVFIAEIENLFFKFKRFHSGEIQLSMRILGEEFLFALPITYRHSVTLFTTQELLDQRIQMHQMHSQISFNFFPLGEFLNNFEDLVQDPRDILAEFSKKLHLASSEKESPQDSVAFEELSSQEIERLNDIFHDIEE